MGVSRFVLLPGTVAVVALLYLATATGDAPERAAVPTPRPPTALQTTTSPASTPASPQTQFSPGPAAELAVLTPADTSQKQAVVADSLLQTTTTAAHSVELERLQEKYGDVLVFPEMTTWVPFCGRLANGTVAKIDGGVRDFTIGVTTYKGHATLANTIKSWTKYGLLTHPSAKEVMFHVNACRAVDVEHIMGELVGLSQRSKIKVTILCSRGNVYHALALFRMAERARTPFLLLSENDRPLGGPLGVTAGLEKRVKNILDTSLAALSQPNSHIEPVHIFLERRLAVEDEAEYARHQRGHKSWGYCWEECLAFLNVTSQTAFCASPKSPCDNFMCIEYNSLITGMRKTAQACTRATERSSLLKGLKRMRVTKDGDSLPVENLRFGTGEAELSCEITAGWSNGPSLQNTTWYRERILGRLCDASLRRTDTGLRQKSGKNHYAWYGRAMEYYLRKHLMTLTCVGDGIFDHVELEDYDNHVISHK